MIFQHHICITAAFHEVVAGLKSLHFAHWLTGTLERNVAVDIIRFTFAVKKVYSGSIKERESETGLSVKRNKNNQSLI